jgi:hypothetical protein
MRRTREKKIRCKLGHPPKGHLGRDAISNVVEEWHPDDGHRDKKLTQ